MHIRDLAATSVAKLIAASSFAGLMLLSLFFALLAMFGTNTVQWNGRYVHGFYAIFPSVAGAAILTLFVTILGSVGFLILRILWPAMSLRSRAAPTTIDD